VTTIPNGGTDPKRTQDIGTSARTPRAARPQSASGEASAASPGASAPALHVSARGERFMSLRARLEGLEASRAERVERLRQLVAEGRYQPDSEAVAAAMLADPATAAALGMP
jgi:flagellar biosynthesis anti-sigma factor FlgM